MVPEKIVVPEKPKPKLKKSTEIKKSQKKIKRTNEPAKPRPKPTPQRPAPKPLTQKEIAERIKSNLPPPKDAVIGPPTDFSRFYEHCHILKESDPERQASWLRLVELTLGVLDLLLDLLGIEIPDRM